MKEGDKVKLIAFNGKNDLDDSNFSEENYEILIGCTGRVVQDPKEPSINPSFTEEKRVLVKFDSNLDALGLANHNNVPNSLWILESDLELL